MLHYGMALMAMPVADLDKAVQKGDRNSPNLLQPTESIAERMRSKMQDRRIRYLDSRTLWISRCVEENYSF